MTTTRGHSHGHRAARGSVAVVAAVLALTSATFVTQADGAAGGATPPGSRVVSFHGYRIAVPMGWQVVDLRSHPHACVRFDRPALYLGSAGDQRACPSYLIGGAPGFQLQVLDARSLRGAGTSLLTVPPSHDIGSVRLPSHGPADVAVEGAGVLLTVGYGEPDATLVQHVISTGRVLAGAVPTLVSSIPTGQTAPAVGASVPGTYLGAGFDTCAAPSQAVMDAWLASSGYASIGVYIGGVDRGCAQPNLTAPWVAAQVSAGWHIIPTYVGLQAPCTSFANRMSYDAATARTQGRTAATDAIAEAGALGIAAPSTLYYDIEAYDSSDPSCVAATLGYLSGWTFILHTQGYESGVYSSAASGIHDLSLHYDSPSYAMPDDIWMAWWNGAEDVNGGNYVTATQWVNHRRDHQYAGNVSENHGGHGLQIDRDYLDVSAAVPTPPGCPTNLDFAAYPVLTLGSAGPEVTAAQCLLARDGFDPGEATGAFGWRTAAAARAFKASCGLESVDPIIRRWAWTALASAGATEFLHLGSTGPRVRKVQRALTARMQETVPISGTFDADTRDAVIAYQATQGLDGTGTVGAVTWRALQHGD